jgi:hypothetical protein
VLQLLQPFSAVDTTGTATNMVLNPNFEAINSDGSPLH